MTTPTCSCEIRPHPSAGLVWVAMTVDRSCGQGHKHGQAFETTRPEEI